MSSIKKADHEYVLELSSFAQNLYTSIFFDFWAKNARKQIKSIASLEYFHFLYIHPLKPSRGSAAHYQNIYFKGSRMELKLFVRTKILMVCQGDFVTIL